VDVEQIDVGSAAEFVEAINSFAAKQRTDQVLWFRGSKCSQHSLAPGLYRNGDRTPEEAYAMEERLITLYRQRSLPFWPEGYPQSDWEHLFSMQHHQVRTRLLDWTENAFVGLWFALDGDCKKDHECSPAVWLLDPQELNRASLGRAHYGE
jgi:hypothetical protein